MLHRIFFSLALLCIILSVVIHFCEKNEKEIIDQAQQQLIRLENQVQKSLDTISTFHSAEQFHEFFIHHGHQNLGFSFFYFQGDSLCYWSDNETPATSILNPDSLKNGGLIRLPNGLYETFVKLNGSHTIAGLLLLHREYAYENKYLVNNFNQRLLLGNNAGINPGNSIGYLLYSSTHQPLLNISFSQDHPAESPMKAGSGLYLFAYLFLLVGIFFRSIKGTNSRPLPVLLVCASMVIIRVLMIVFHFPSPLYDTDFFSPKVYASSFLFNSNGDLFLNSFTFLIIVVLLYFNRKLFELKNRSAALPIIFLLLLCTLAYFSHQLISGLIINSKISFDLNNVSDFDINTLAAVISILSLLWGLAFCFGMAFSITGASANIKSRLSYLPVLLVILFSIYTTVVIHHYTAIKENENQKLFARRLDTFQDHLAEYLFEDVEKHITSDSIISRIIKGAEIKKERGETAEVTHKRYHVRHSVNDEVNKRLQQFYFNGYWNKFDITTWCYDQNDSAFEQSQPRLQDFQSQAAEQGKETYCDKMFFLPNESGRLEYLAILPLGNGRDTAVKTGTIVLRFDSRNIQPTEGFPELFVSKRVRETSAENIYSFARYNNGSLASVLGNYPYAFSPADFANANGEFSFLYLDKYVHLVYKPSPATLIVVSRPKETFFKTVSLFSSILLFFSLVSFLLFGWWRFLFTSKLKPITLKQRIRFSIVTLVVLSFILIGTGTVFYIIRKYDKDQDQNILAKLNSLWLALYDNFNLQTGLETANLEEWSAKLNQLADNLNEDFNLYDESGHLFYSSQGKIFDEGIIGTRMNPEAMFELTRNNRTQFVHPENIGRLNYISAYAPFTDDKGYLSGYLNVPYFEKQNELKKEISGFLSAIINIYVLFLILAILLALFISSRITQPLLLIQERLKNVRLREVTRDGWQVTSEGVPGFYTSAAAFNASFIEWKGNDEIGELVKEYNRMVAQLQESAERLARSERESAWREMAQQVAHEIKNPLTPMKLSVQHLQQAWNEKRGNLDELINRISKTLIEQINTLSNIATEFSNFAKMPKTRKEIFDLNETVESVIHLFENTEGIQFIYKSGSVPQKINADRDQLQRVFSNLVKNAIQSIQHKKGNGVITIKINSSNGMHHLEISDTGEGISEASKSKIFSPYFTTKTSGMGLGLAMVKSIIEDMGGSIRFESKESQGTTFFIDLPEHKA